ncbi:Pentatricopeptide repeat-containing protein At3g22150, chloroplastic [Linum grandiflorum]
MIGGYVQNNRPRESVDLFLRAIEAGQTDSISYLSVLTAVSQLQCLDSAQQLHAFVIKNLGAAAAPVVIQNAVIVMYSRCNAVETSFDVFQQMPERDVVSWNTMVSAFVQNGFDDEGLILVHEMQKQKFSVDEVTVTALLSAASNLRNLQIGKQTHCYILRQGVKFEGMESYLVDMYAKCGSTSISTAEHIFWTNLARSRDQATWNGMIAGYTQNGLVEEAFTTFRKMLQLPVMPNAVTLASILPACTQMGSINLGKQLHAVSIRRMFDQNIFLSSALVDMYSKSGSIRYAESVFFARCPDRNSVTYTAMILGYGQHGMGEKALSLFHSIDVKPDAVTIVALLSACSYCGLVNEGLEVFKSMEKEFGIEPTVQHYCCVADMLGRAGRVAEAYEFVEQLGEKGNVVQIWGSVLGACRLHGHKELGEAVLKRIEGIGGAGYQVLMSNIYGGEGDWRSVDRVRKGMREKGLQKVVGRSWINIGGNVTRFVSKDQDHNECDRIYDALEGLAMEMKHSDV